MATIIPDDPLGGLRIRRSVITSNGFPFEPDQTVKAQLDELNQLLLTPILPEAAPVAVDQTAKANGRALRRKKKNADGQDGLSELMLLLGLHLSPKRVSAGVSTWPSRSLAATIHKRSTSAAASERAATLSDYVENIPAVLQLKFAFLDGIDKYWSMTNQSAQMIVKQYPAITDYLILGAYYTKQIQDPDALRIYITDGGNPNFTARAISDYAAISAARVIIDSGEIKVDNPNDDNSPFVQGLRQNPLPLSATQFRSALDDRISGFVFDRDIEKIIDNADIDVPDDIKPQLVKMLKAFNTTPGAVKITAKNARVYLPNMVMQILQSNGISAQIDDAGQVDPSDSDFNVQFTDSTDSSTDINKSGVLCAAQLFHSMVLGEELDVFGAVNYLVQKRLIMNGGLRIESALLRSDIKTYALSNKFINIKNGLFDDRTRPAERQMFHRQVFNYGRTAVPEDLPLNPEFKRLWSVLMLESARYIERAQASLSPVNLVSRQNVQQAVEDLQYNLSIYCTGMATLMSPVVDAELNFVLRRILEHDEILKQVVPEGGNWKLAVDRLNAERRVQPGNASTLYNKAVVGKQIINAIAAYTTNSFEDNNTFSAFISMVDAFITTQSILQRKWKMALPKRDDDIDRARVGDQDRDYDHDRDHDDDHDHGDTDVHGDEMPAASTMPPPNGKPANVNGHAGDWDF